MKQLLIALLAVSTAFGQAVPQFEPLGVGDIIAVKSSGSATLSDDATCAAGVSTTGPCPPSGVAAAIAAQVVAAPFPASLSGSNKVLNIGAGKYNLNSTPYSVAATAFTQAQPTIISATAANPMVIEVNADTVSQTLMPGMKMSIAGALPAGCAGMNGQFTVTAVANNGSAQRRVITLAYNNSSGCTYTANSAKFGANTSMSGVWAACLTLNQEVALITPVDAGVYITATGPYLVRQTSLTPSCDITVTGEYGWKTLHSGTLSSSTNGEFTALDSTSDKRSMIDSFGLLPGTGIEFDPTGGTTTLRLIDAPYLSGTNAFTGSTSFAAASSIIAAKSVTATPSTCLAGASFYDSVLKHFLDCTDTDTPVVRGAPTLTARPAFWPFGFMDGAIVATETIGSANRVLYAAFDVPAEGITFSTVAMYMSVATGNISIEIMDSSCNKITNGNSSTSVAPGFAVIVLTMPATITLTQGRYYFGWSSNQTADAPFRSAGNFVGEYQSGQSGTALSYFYGSNAASGANPNVLPSACGTRTANAVSRGLPAVMLR